MVAIYEPGAEPVRVTIDQPGRELVLILSAYEATRWQIELSPMTRISRVHVLAYGAQVIEGLPAGIERIDEEDDFSDLFADSVRTRIRRDTLERLVGARIRAHLGCYSGRAFAVRGR